METEWTRDKSNDELIDLLLSKWTRQDKKYEIARSLRVRMDRVQAKPHRLTTQDSFYCHYLFQSKFWRDGGGRELVLTEMSDQHLENLLKWLMANKYWIVEKVLSWGGLQGLPLDPTLESIDAKRWISRLPLFKAVEAELAHRVKISEIRKRWDKHYQPDPIPPSPALYQMLSNAELTDILIECEKEWIRRGKR